MLASGATPRALILKSRQIGASTYFCFLDVFTAFLNPGIKVAIVVDTDAKAKELLARAKVFADRFAELFGFRVSGNAKTIRLSHNNSEIHALTSGADPRSRSFQTLHLTELPSWENEGFFQEILATCPGAAIWGETTARGTENLFARLWNTPNEFEKIFFSLELHQHYQLAAETITDAQWADLQGLGFSSRTHAAWWHRQLLSIGNGGEYDRIKLLHDYPVQQHHAFLVYEGRWIRRDPKVVVPALRQGVSIFKPIEKRHAYVCAVDTAAGKGRDGSAIVVLDKTTSELVACWKDNLADIKTVVERLQVIQELYKPAPILIETNGVGEGTFQEARRKGLAVRELTQTEATKTLGLQAARRAIEDGRVYGPQELLSECQALHIDRHERFKGAKDLLMCIGMALQEIQVRPHSIPEPRDQNKLYLEDYLPQDRSGAEGWV